MPKHGALAGTVWCVHACHPTPPSPPSGSIGSETDARPMCHTPVCGCPVPAPACTLRESLYFIFNLHNHGINHEHGGRVLSFVVDDRLVFLLPWRKPALVRDTGLRNVLPTSVGSCRRASQKGRYNDTSYDGVIIYALLKGQV
jgi:hypothetical protein